MRKLKLYGDSPLTDEGVAEMASCVDKIEKLKFHATEVTINGLAILATAINNRPTPVS